MQTYQDYLGAEDPLGFLENAINEYKNSAFFLRALEAESYFFADNTGILHRPKWRMTKTGREITFSQNIAVSNFFFRFVVQQNQFLLANGLQTEDPAAKEALGRGFDKVLESIGEKALIHGVAWGFWNHDHLERFDAVGSGGGAGFFTLLDERSGVPMIGIRFWQIDGKKPLHIQVFDNEKIVEYSKTPGKEMVHLETTPYLQTIRKDGISSEVIHTAGYDALPIFPLYANDFGRSEFSGSIQSKIDLFDKIFSDFGDNLERTNDIYWVISNFGGTTDEIKTMLAEIEEIKATYTEGDGTCAVPHTIEVPFAARQTALSILRKELYADYMALDMDSISGGSLTNVAINAAKANLDMKVNRYEWQVFDFCQKLLSFMGLETENIRFRRQTIANEQEIMSMLTQCRNDLDLRTALEKNPLVESDEVDVILSRKAAETGGVWQ